MPYVTESRGSRPLTSEARGAGNRLERYRGYTRFEAVYSFRTGKRANSVKPSPEETYQPSGNLAERLIYRKKFIERQLSNILSDGRTSPTHFLLGDMGHEFATSKTAISTSVWNRSGRTNLQPRAFPFLTSTGTLVPSGAQALKDWDKFWSQKGLPFDSAGTSIGPSRGQISGLASLHISDMNPFAAKANLLTSLIELARGDVPKVLADLRRHFKTIQGLKASGIKSASAAVGSEYLNGQFGWVPVIKDVEAAIRVLSGLDQLIFDSDSTRRSVKRTIYTRHAMSNGNAYFRNQFPLQGVLDDDAWKWVAPAPPVITGGGSGINSQLTLSAVQTASESLSLWTTARFKTGAHPSLTNNGYLDRAIDLLGLEITPETLWELTPWSWLIDWFSNIGTVIGNLSTLGLSNTILNYAYSTARLRTVGGIDALYGSEKVYSSISTDQKLRIAATPFGVFASLDSLSSGQWAILVALGLARSR